jgi:hypothetical protein
MLKIGERPRNRVSAGRYKLGTVQPLVGERWPLGDPQISAKPALHHIHHIHQVKEERGERVPACSLGGLSLFSVSPHARLVNLVSVVKCFHSRDLMSGEPLTIWIPAGDRELIADGLSWRNRTRLAQSGCQRYGAIRVRIHPGMPFGFPSETVFGFAGILNRSSTLCDLNDRRGSPARSRR